MDAYVAKPIRPRELMKTIDEVVGSHREAASEQNEGSPANSALHPKTCKLLHRSTQRPRLPILTETRICSGKRPRLFLESCPRLLVAIDNALDGLDLGALARAAHSLKGSVANFRGQAGF